MSQINSICPPQPDWQTLVQDMSQDNSEIKAILSRIGTDSDAQYAEDMTSIATLEGDENTVCNELSREVSKTSDPTQSRADLTQLEGDLQNQKANVSLFNHYRQIDPQGQFQYYVDLGKAMCDYNIAPDINTLRQDA